MSAEVPISRVVDRRFAAFVTFVPPLTFFAALWLHLSGRVPVGWREILVCGVMFVLCLSGVEVGFHRLFSHRTYVPSRYFKIVMAILGSMAFQGPVIWWAGIHRKHHRFSDVPEDPHSMYLDGDRWLDRVKGFIHAQFGWIWRAKSIRFPELPDYVLDLYRDPDLFWVQVTYSRWALLGLALPTLLGAALHGSLKGALLGLVWGGPIRIFFMNHLSFWSINTVGHGFGYRSFETADRSTNNWLLGLVTFGQGFHNNHHARPNSYQMGRHWWEIDIGTVILRISRQLGWVYSLKGARNDERG